MVDHTDRGFHRCSSCGCVAELRQVEQVQVANSKGGGEPTFFGCKQDQRSPLQVPRSQHRRPPEERRDGFFLITLTPAAMRGMRNAAARHDAERSSLSWTRLTIISGAVELGHVLSSAPFKLPVHRPIGRGEDSTVPQGEG